MGRLITAIGAMTLGVTLAAALAASGETLLALGFAALSVMIFVGVLADPKVTGVITLGAVGLALTSNGMPLEGTGMFVLALVAGGRMVRATRPRRPHLYLVR